MQKNGGKNFDSHSEAELWMAFQLIRVVLLEPHFLVNILGRTI